MKHFCMTMLGTFLTVGAIAASATAGDTGAYEKQILDWRAHRAERLQAPNGWLSLIGLEWLKEGANKIGSAKDNAIVIAKAPPHLGTITLDRGKATVSLDPRAKAKIDGESKPGAELLDDTHDKPTTVSFGTVNFFLVQRGDKYGLRIKDSEAVTRTHFVGLDYFDVDPSWRIEAKWEAYNPPHQGEQANMLGQIEKTVIPGAAVFERDGKTFRVEPVVETPGDTNLFLVIADRTSGKETYGASRFVYTEPPKDGKVILDFNEAYNPPCAFTPFATCPLPTPQNRLDARVTAGEKKYKGGHE
jgi:uncharacterized protein